MTLSEFSNEFDLLYNNIMSNQAPGLDSYEKSVFLTMAQEEVIKSYFSRALNKTQEGFDDSPQRQIDFSMLIAVAGPTISKTQGAVNSEDTGVAEIALPSNIMMILNEVLTVNRDSRGTVRLQVIPITYSDYSRLMSKAYKRPMKSQAWRLQVSSTNSASANLIASYGDSPLSYTIRYVKRPYPIIIEPLEDGLTIDGYVGGAQSGNTYVPLTARASIGMPCLLDPILHRDILQRAVELAKAAYTEGLQGQLILGQTSATNIGVVASNK